MLHRLLIYRRIREFSRLLLRMSIVLALVLTLIVPSAGGIAHAATPTSGPVVVRPGGAQIYSAPDGEVVGTLPTSTVFIASGRTEDAQWVVGEATDGSGVWLRVEQVIAVGVELLPVVTESASALPVVEDSPAPEEAVVPTESPAATPTQTSTTTLVGTVASGDDRLNVRSGPGTSYAIVAKALPGESYALVGRTEDATWLQIERENGETGWVSAAYFEVEGEVNRLPIVTAAIPSPTPIPTAAPQTATPQTAALSGAAASDLHGTLVIQSSPGGMIHGYSLDKGTLWPLTRGFDPAISPDGQTVAFVRDGGENGIYLIEIDGSNEQLIFSGRERLSAPKWSPDGQWILFTRSDDSYRCYDLGRSCISPIVGPDGEEITLPGAEMTTRYWYNLAVVDRDGNNYRDLASLNTARAADWNEAGIVYQSDAGLQITTDAPDAENQLVIFDYLKPYYDDPDWQPQGGRIVYMGKEASHWELFTVNADGSDKRALTRPATTIVDELPSNVAPAWSPDGQHIAFLSNRMENGEAGAWRVWVMDADGSNQRLLPLNLEINYTFGGEQAISWTH